MKNTNLLSKKNANKIKRANIFSPNQRPPRGQSVAKQENSTIAKKETLIQLIARNQLSVSTTTKIRGIT